MHLGQTRAYETIEWDYGLFFTMFRQPATSAYTQINKNAGSNLMLQNMATYGKNRTKKLTDVLAPL